MQDRHLSEQSLKAAAIKRQQQMAAHGSNSAASGAAGSAPPAPPVYPPDAAIQAIRRFNPKPPYPEFLVGLVLASLSLCDDCFHPICHPSVHRILKKDLSPSMSD